MFEKIRLWWKFEGRYYHKNFIQGVKNLWRWFPTVWKDRDWDGYFIYEILRVKLENQAYYIGNRDRHVESKRDTERMLLCARLIKIQQEDLYAIEYLDYYKEDHKFIPTDETKQWYTMENTLIKDNLDEYFAIYPKQYKKYNDGTRERHQIAFSIAVNNQERSRKLLFKIIERHIDRWWN